MLKNAILIGVVAVVVAILYQSDLPISGTKITLGSGGYDIVPLQAPAATSTMLDVLSVVLTRSIFGNALRRMLLNDNKIVNVRELASQIEMSPLYYPMKRLSPDRLASAETEELQKAELLRVLQEGFEGADTEGVSRSAMDYHQQYQSGQFTPTQVMEKTLATVAQWDQEGFHLFSSIRPEDVMAEARASEQRFKAGRPLSVLDGVPIAFKDMMSIKGHTVYAGRNPATAQVQESPVDDVMVTRFRELGAIIFGVTIMVEGGVSPLGYNSWFKGPVNSYNANRYSGGSSSGSAVVVSSGIVPIAIGFDGGGSIRIPSSMSGIHGLATTFGRLAYDNHSDSTMIKAGPMTASSVDAAITFAALSPAAPGNFYTTLYDGGVHGPPQAHLTAFDQTADLAGVRLGIFPEWFEDSNPAIRRRCYEVVAFLESRGATVVRVSIPHLQLMSLSHGVKIASEFAMDNEREYHAHPGNFEPNTRIVVGLGLTATAEECLSMDKLRAWGFKYVDDLYVREGLTAIVNPTIGVDVPHLSEEAKLRGESNTALVVNVIKHIFMANFLGLPGYSVPVGFVPAEKTAQDSSEPLLPVGFHLQGNHWSEAELLRLAHTIEVGFTRRLHQKTAPKAQYFHDPFAK